jgi:hypothetical protein
MSAVNNHFFAEDLFHVTYWNKSKKISARQLIFSLLYLFLPCLTQAFSIMELGPTFVSYKFCANCSFHFNYDISIKEHTDCDLPSVKK